MRKFFPIAVRPFWFFSFVFLLFLPDAKAQRFISKTLLGDNGPLDGQAMRALFLGPWQVKVKDTLAFITDKDNNSIRELNIKRKLVKTLIANQSSVSGLAISHGGDSLFFCTSNNILKLYRRSTGTLSVLDTLPDNEIDAIECTRKGNLVIGSAFGHRVLFKDDQGQWIVLAGKLGVSGFADGRDTVARFNRIASLLLSQTEDTIFICDRFNSRIRRLIRSTKQVSTLTTITALFGPRQIAFNRRKDSMFVANSSGHTVFRINLRNNTGSQWCGLNTSAGYQDGTGTASRFNFPMGIALCDSGWLVCDNSNRRIRLIKPSGLVRTFAGVGFLGDGVGTGSRFGLPYDIVRHPSKDTAYISDQSNNAIRMVNLRTMEVTTLAGNGTLGTINAVGSAARLNRPTGMAISPNGDTLFFVEPFGNKIRFLLTRTLEVKWLAGSDTAGYVDKPVGRFARFNRPSDVAYKDGFLYVADANNHKIRRIHIPTSAVTTFAGSTSGYKDSTLLGSRFNRPNTLEWVDNVLFVGEDAGLRIRKLMPSADQVKNWAGNGNLGNNDGFGTQARFKGIFKITHDPVGNRLMVGGYLNEGICRYVQLDTNFTGTFLSQTGYQDGELVNTRFTGPLGFLIDEPNSRYLVADAGNQRIRELRWIHNTAPTCTFDTTTVTLLEDQLQTAFLQVAQNLTPGNSSGDTLQTLSFLIKPNTPNLLAISSISTSDGALNLQPVGGEFGTTELKVILKDNGGATLSGSVDTSVYRKKIVVLPVNDPPLVSFQIRDTFPNTSPALKKWIFSSVPGPANESNQVLAFDISVSNPEFFISQPILVNDSISFVPSPTAIGTTDGRLIVKDNGGTENNGIDADTLYFTLTLFDPVGVKKSSQSKVQVFPNPARSHFQIVPGNSVASTWRLLDLLGREIMQFYVNGETRVQVPSDLNGLFILQSEQPDLTPIRIFIQSETKD